MLIALARRVQEALDQPVDAADPGRELLGGVRAPLSAEVVDALGLDATPRPQWTVDGAPVDDDTVCAAQLAWYGTHPQWITAGLDRHAARMELIGMG